MKHFLSAFLLLGTLSACQQPTVQTPSIQTPAPVSPSPGQASTAPANSTLVVGLNDLSRAEAVAALVGGTVMARLPALNAALIALNGPRPDPAAAALALNVSGQVVYATAQTDVPAGDPLERARAPGLLPQAVNQRIDGLPQYALDANHLNARAAWDAGLRGAGVTVGIVDAPADVAHPDLSGRWAGRAYDPVLNAEYTTAADWTAAVARMAGGGANADGPGNLDLDHGTAVASAAVAAQNGSGMVGAAPDARFLSAAVFQPTSAGVQFVGSFDAARAVVWSVDAGAKVINLSWGSFGYDPLLKAATDYALSRGVTVVAAAGNTGRQERQQPAMYPGVLASVAGDLAGRRASFSAYGYDPAPITPGLDLLLARSGWGAQAGAGGYALYSGTSFSTPLLAGGAALLLGADVSLDPYQVRTLLSRASGPGTSGSGLGQNPGQLDLGQLDLGRLPALMGAPRPAAAARALISLKVRTDGGDVPALLGDLTLLSTDPGGPVYLARTDAQGQAAFYAVQPGSYRVLAAAPDLHVTGGQASERGSLSADLTLPPGVFTAQTYVLDRGAVNLHPTDPYEPNDDPGAAAPLSYGARTSLAYIAGKPRDVDYFAFQGQAGDRIRASISARGDPAVGGQLDSVLVLRGPADQIVGYNDDYVNSDSRLELTLPLTGRYTLEVSSFRILGPSMGTDPAQGQPDDSPFNRYRLRLEQLNAP